jgi:hypothetical protein
LRFMSGYANQAPSVTNGQLCHQVAWRRDQVGQGAKITVREE